MLQCMKIINTMICTFLMHLEKHLKPETSHHYRQSGLLIPVWFLGERRVNRKPQCKAGAHALLEMSV